MKKLIIFLIAFCLVFTIAAVGITYSLIPKEEASVSSVSPPDLYGTYDNNDLLVEQISVEYKNIENVQYIQIKGLKNTAIEEKINMELKDALFSAIDSLPQCDYAYATLHGNFANVLSVSYNASYYDNETDISDSTCICLNYNLVTGKQIKFEDLFINEELILDMIRTTFYRELVFSGEYDRETYVHSPDENKVYSAVKAFMNGEKTKFAFSPSYINFYDTDEYARMMSANLIDYADNIAIYSRFLTDESIFTGEFPAHKNIFTFANGNYDYFDRIEYGLWEDNLWVDFSTSRAYEVKEPDAAYIAFKEQKYIDLYNNLDSYRDMAKENPDKFYILMAKPYVSQYTWSKYTDGEWHDTPSLIASVNFNSNIIEMPIEVYKNTYRDKIIEGYRYQYFTMGGGLNIFPEEGDGAVLRADNYKAETYNYKTGELLTELSDVFSEDSDYMSTLEKEVSEYLRMDNISSDYLSEAVYVLSGDGIRVTLPSFPKEEYFVHFSNFDKESFKLLYEEE